MINENISSSSVNVFATRFVAFRLIISNSIPDWKLTKVGSLFGNVCWRLNKDTSIIPHVVIRFNALDEIIDFRTEFSDLENIFVLLLGGVGKLFVSVDPFIMHISVVYFTVFVFFRLKFTIDVIKLYFYCSKLGRFPNCLVFRKLLPLRKVSVYLHNFINKTSMKTVVHLSQQSLQLNY